MAQRRKFLAVGGSLITGAMAGCTSSGSGSESTDQTTAGNAENETEAASESSADGSYTVTVEPYGSHTFEEVPETYFASVWSGFGISLNLLPTYGGRTDKINGKFYDLIPGLNYDTSKIQTITGGKGGFDKEVFYQTDPDVIFQDPRYLKQQAGWSDQDVEEIATNVAPLLGSQIHQPMNNQEPYYDLYGAFEKVAQVFQRQEQYDAWEEYHAEILSDVQSRLPPEDERPTATCLIRGVNPASGHFIPVHIREDKSNTRTLGQLGVKDVFEGQNIDGEIGIEAILEADPDIIAIPSLWMDTHEEFVTNVVEPLENNDQTSGLTAVQEGNLVRTVGHYIDPITDLFSLEAAAKQIYPEEFGEWPGPIGQLSSDQQLFDRQRVSDLVTGDL
ncbi:iron complex transport system substrate-binding protein [Halorubrum trapanicum]|uniref:Iron complex transport system substrate-binding protein n=1 Tax=Halorubrum trapanicum TaxID=29284 RepID=A0A8J7UPF1_9EURY|nr:ABC transporter substrate-binding protein [Halorubrum trapanicum]MBP1902836.1 iron complex transport system substrate-binding protein [Halorubrum trapanicum]